MSSHLGPLSQVRDRRSCSGSVPITLAISSRRPRRRDQRVVAHSSPVAADRAVHRQKVQQHREPRRALHEVPIADLFSPMIKSPSQWPGTARSAASPTARDHDLRVTNFLPRPFVRARYTQRSPSAQTGDELALECAAALNAQRLMDRFVRYPHRLILGEVDFDRFEICSRLHDVAHRRSARRP